MYHRHATTVKALGGSTALGREFGYTAQRVDRWRRIGIPLRLWPRIAMICTERKVRVPADIQKELKSIREFLA